MAGLTLHGPIILATRIVVSLLAITVIVGMGIHYDVKEDRHWPYPDSDDLATEYDEHVGEKTLLFGTVVSVDESTDKAEIKVKHTDGVILMTVRGFESDVDPGGSVQVSGTLEYNYELSADRIVVVNSSRVVEILKFGLSGLGALLVLVTFFGQWRVNRTNFSFEAR